SYTDPWKVLVPDLVAELITAPLPPNSALYVFVSVWNSAIPSIPSDVPVTAAPVPLCHQFWMFSPSSNIPYPSGREPEIEYVAARRTSALLPHAGYDKAPGASRMSGSKLRPLRGSSRI